MISGRRVLAGVSVVLCVLAVYVYLTRDDKLRLDVVSTDNEPKVRLHGFEFFKYHENDLMERTAGNDAVLLDPGKILVSGGVRSVRLREKRREELTSEFAEILLNGEKGQGIFAKSTVQTINLKKDVELKLGDWRLVTEEANYTEATGMVTSVTPVRIDSEDQFMAGEKGFEYNVKTESLKMQGGVSGSIFPSKIAKASKELK